MEARAGVGWTLAVPLKSTALYIMDPQQISGTNGFLGQGGVSWKRRNEGIYYPMGLAGILRPWAFEHAPGQIHIPDRTGTGDTGADQTAGEKEAVSAILPAPSPNCLKPTASASGLEGNFLPKTPGPWKVLT